ncbi:MAG TPA: hypothetical protein PLM24_05105 [Methanothrix sp.]|nr:hypothetical protein [Methanothrix sp.]HPJ83965.1 hypothetical protein [Methanothrix sp.]HPR66496.1 hypothetical protein [Methanothrix sp.]
MLGLETEGERYGVGSADAAALVAELSLRSGGIVKFDFKAFDENLSLALSGASNRRPSRTSRWSQRTSSRLEAPWSARRRPPRPRLRRRGGGGVYLGNKYMLALAPP